MNRVQGPLPSSQSSDVPRATQGTVASPFPGTPQPVTGRLRCAVGMFPAAQSTPPPCLVIPVDTAGITEGGNRYEIRDGFAVVVLERRSGAVLETMIDIEDLPRIAAHPRRWHAADSRDHKYTYAQSRDAENRTIKLHRFIMNPESRAIEIDHWSHDGLDNRRQNLRATTVSMNQLNRIAANRNNASTGHRGVFYDEQSNKWKAAIKVNYRRHHLGTFDTVEGAVTAVSVAQSAALNGDMS